MRDQPPCPEHLRKAFLEEPTYVPLNAGERLYKFVSIPIVRQRILDSPWWIRQRAFDDLQERARRLQKPVAELARSQMAIAMEWNPGMDTMYVIVLAAKADGWEGRARWQPVSTADRTVLFTGGGRQLAVPGLTWRQIGVHYTGWPPAR
jgi:hypothetical protein